MTKFELEIKAYRIKGFKKFCNKLIDEIHLMYLNRLSLLCFEKGIKPTFTDMFIFTYKKPTKNQMEEWLREYN